MKKLFPILTIFFLGMIAWGCSEDYDDSALWKEINDLKAQVEKLNTDLAKVQTTITKLESGKYVTDYTKTETGCVLTFSDNSTVTVENGKAGADAPAIGIQENNGTYYWTLTINGETNWLTTPAPDNKMIPVSGKTPVMGVDADGYWTVDGLQLKDDNNNPVKAGVNAALSIFTGSEENDDTVILTLASGDKIVLPKTGFAIKISVAKAEFAYEQKQTFAVKMKGIGKTTFTKPDGWKVDLTNDILTVTAPVEANTYADTAGVIAIIGISGNSSCMAELKVACGKGKVLYSTDGGTTWSETAPARNTEGNLLIIKSTYGATLTNTNLKNVCARTKFKSYDLSDFFIADDDAKSAFAGNTTVTSVILPPRMTHLPDLIFSGCSKLTDITYPPYLTRIGSGCFNKCPFTSFVVPEGIDTLKGTFSGCAMLTSVEFPTTLKYIGASTFKDCKALVSFKFPTEQTSIEASTFEGCSALASIGLPSALTDIGNSAFASCTALTSIGLPSTLTRIGENTFYGSGLTSINLPSALEYIGEGAFKGMNAITKVEIPEGVTYLGKMMFYFYPGFGVGTGTSSLQEIIIPSTVTDWQMGTATTGSYWFYGCTSLQKIICRVVTPVEAQTGDWGDFKDVPSTCVIYVPDASVEAYKVTAGWQDFTIKGISEL